MSMRRVLCLALLTCTACTSAEDKARAREQQMIEQARADSAAEADFVADSVALANSITVDSIRELRMRDVREIDDDGNEVLTRRYEAVGTHDMVCAVETTRYALLVRGDTLRCQWGPPPP